MKQRIAIFAHWDKDNRVAPYVLYYLEELSKEADIIFVSDCSLPPAETEKVVPLTIQVIAAPHGEYDFGSYKRGYQYFRELDTNQYTQLILANDSCYGPFSPFRDLFDRMDQEDVDFWGIFEHNIHSDADRHLQSFFLSFSQKVFMADAFSNFLNHVRALPNKREIITAYEVGLSRQLKAIGFRYSSLIAFTGRNLTYQPEAFTIIDSHQMPLLKRRLLTENPANCPQLITSVRNFFERHHASPVLEHITADLQEMNYSSRDCWHLFDPLQTCFLHRKFFSIEEKVYSWKAYTVVRVSFLGLRILKLKGRRNVLYNP